MPVKKQIHMTDFPRESREIGQEINRALRGVLKSGWYILGDQVKAFEYEFSHYVGVNYGVGVNSGTDALFLSLIALGVREGDEVITVSHTFGSTALPILFLGARPIFVDVAKGTYTMNVSQIASKITSKTRAIIPVHLYGNPAEISSICEIAERRHIPVLEDACQAHGAEYKGRRAGSFGMLSAFSFYPTKNLGCYGDGGMILTNEKDLYQRLRMLRQYGWKGRDDSRIWGTNSRLDEIQAAVLRAKLSHLNAWNERRRIHANLYNDLLRGVDLPVEQSNGKHVYHQYVISTRRRDALKKFLAEKGIETGIHYHLPAHLQETFLNLGISVRLPVTEGLYRRILSLPVHPWLSEDDLQYVSASISEYLEKYGQA